MRQRFVSHDNIWPDRLEQLLLGHQAIWILQEIAQQLEALPAKRNLAIRGSQRVACNIERISLELEHLERRAGRLPSQPLPHRGSAEWASGSNTIAAKLQALQRNYTVLSRLRLPFTPQSAQFQSKGKHHDQLCTQRAQPGGFRRPQAQHV
jgi:hypothetical protein